MGNTADGRYIGGRAITLQASVVKTASFVSATQEPGDLGVVRLTLAVTAASGTTPTLDVVVETSLDGTTWRSLGAFTQKTIVASERKSFSGVDRYIRANATVAGTTPSFTYSIAGLAV